MKLGHVKVEETDAGDHYDPEAKAIRLLPKHLNGRSLAAVVIAAHEAGHAMQDATGYPPLQARTRLAKQAITGGESRRRRHAGGAHRHGAGQGAAHADHRGIRRRDDLRAVDPDARRHAAGGVRRAASAARCPVLKAGRYLDDKDMPAAKQILRAAAFTYVAAAAMSLLDVARWLRVLRI